MLPQLAVFDLDDTLWTPEMWLLSGSPFTRDDSSGRVFDRKGQHVYLFNEAKSVLEAIHVNHNGAIKVGYASRTEYPEWAMECLKLIRVGQSSTMYDIMHIAEIYPSNKIKHFKNIHKKTGISYEEMVFFDNEYRNIQDVSTLGVVCVYTPDGMTRKAWQEGLSKYQSSKL
jgi:magnesium-dependent phosphatase 1